VANESKERAAVFERAFERACWWSELVAKAAPIDIAGAWRDDVEMFESIAKMGRDDEERGAARARLENSGAFANQEAMWAEDLSKRAASAFGRACIAARRGKEPLGESENEWRDAALHVDEAARFGVESAKKARTVILRVLESLSSGMAYDQVADVDAKGWREVFEVYGVRRADLPSDLSEALSRVAERLENSSYVFTQGQNDVMKQMAREVEAGRGAMFARVEALVLGESVSSVKKNGSASGPKRSL
jgi:hypothetical protein